MARKRGNNEGTIHQRSNGTWRAQITLEGRRLNFGAKTRRECQEWLKKTVGQIDNGLTFAGAQSTVKEFMEGWLVSVESSLRPDTLVQYKQITRDYILPYLGKIKLKDLRPDQIQKLYDHQLKAGIGSRTVQLIHAVLHRAMGHAFKLGLIPRNPAGVVTRPKTQHEEMKVFDESQVNQFLLAAVGERNEALYHLAITTGMRQSELLALKWADLDWNSRHFRYSAS